MIEDRAVLFVSALLQWAGHGGILIGDEFLTPCPLPSCSCFGAALLDKVNLGVGKRRCTPANVAAELEHRRGHRGAHGARDDLDL